MAYYIHVPDHPIGEWLVGPFDTEAAADAYVADHVEDPDARVIDTDRSISPDDFAHDSVPPHVQEAADAAASVHDQDDRCAQ